MEFIFNNVSGEIPSTNQMTIAKGDKGDRGDRGDPGVKGDKGDKGDVGVVVRKFTVEADAIAAAATYPNDIIILEA